MLVPTENEGAKMAVGSRSKTPNKPPDDMMPTPAPGAAAGRREQILQAAQKLFAEKGFRETNLGDVATQLGFRRQAVYHYFPSKDDILYELIDRAGRSVATSAQPIMDAQTPPAEKLAEVVRNHVRQLLTNVDIFRIQFSELFKLTSDRADMLRRDISAYTHAIAEVIAAGQKDGTFVDVPPMTQTLLILGMCNGTTEWYSARSRPSIDEIADDAARMALTGATGTKHPER
jgi:AcrR family transcriptional regulator